MKEDNLVSLADRTPEERSEIARKGGIASGESKREKKLLSEKYLEYINKKNFDELFDSIIERKDSASVSLIKEFRDGTEGSKLEHSGEVKSKITVEIIDHSEVK